MEIQQELGVEQLLSPREFAERLSISRWTVYSWVASGRIAYSKIGRLVRIRASEIERIVDQGRRDVEASR